MAAHILDCRIGVGLSASGRDCVIAHIAIFGSGCRFRNARTLGCDNRLERTVCSGGSVLFPVSAARVIADSPPLRSHSQPLGAQSRGVYNEPWEPDDTRQSVDNEFRSFEVTRD